MSPGEQKQEIKNVRRVDDANARLRMGEEFVQRTCIDHDAVQASERWHHCCVSKSIYESDAGRFWHCAAALQSAQDDQLRCKVSSP